MREEITIPGFCTKHTRGFTAVLLLGEYDTGRAAIQVFTEQGEPMLTATVNVVAVEDLLPGETHVRTWAENEGILEELVRHGVVVDTGRRDRTGFVEAAVVTLGPAWHEGPAN